MDENQFPGLPNIPQDVLQDLCSRFLINIPDNEKNDMVRICFQIELAHWYYIDFCRQDDPDLPACGMKAFIAIIFSEFKFLNKSKESIQTIYDNWKQYKVRVPVFGAILIDETLEKCLLVQGFHSKTSWGFPKGKINKDEADLDCAIREVWEEVGYDIKPLAKPDQFLENNIHDHQVRLYIVAGVNESYNFQPNTRGEIKDIQWFNINHLPTHKRDPTPKDEIGLMANNFFMIHSFIKPLRKWVSEKKESMYSYNPILALQKHIESVNKSSSSPQVKQTADEYKLQKKRRDDADEFKRMHMLMNPLGSSKTDEDVLKSLLGMKISDKPEEKHLGQPEAIRKLLSGTVKVSPQSTPQKPKHQRPHPIAANMAFRPPSAILQRGSPNSPQPFGNNNPQQYGNNSPQQYGKNSPKLYSNNSPKPYNLYNNTEAKNKGKLSYSSVAYRSTKNTKEDKSRNKEYIRNSPDFTQQLNPTTSPNIFKKVNNIKNNNSLPSNKPRSNSITKKQRSTKSPKPKEAVITWNESAYTTKSSYKNSPPNSTEPWTGLGNFQYSAPAFESFKFNYKQILSLL